MTMYWRIDSKQDFHAQRAQTEVLKIEDCASICSDRWFWDLRQLWMTKARPIWLTVASAG